MSTDVAAGPSRPPAISRQPRVHPPYSEMVQKAITELKERGGSSKAAILRYLVQNYQLGDNVNKINTNIRMALKKGVEKGDLKQVTGVGATGSFKLGEKRAAALKVKKPIAKRANKETNPAPVKKEKKEKPAASKKPKTEKALKSSKKASSTHKSSKKEKAPAAKSSRPHSSKSTKKTTSAKSK